MRNQEHRSHNREDIHSKGEEEAIATRKEREGEGGGGETRVFLL